MRRNVVIFAEMPCFSAPKLQSDRGVLPADQRSTPGKSAAHCFKDHDVTALDATVMDSLGQRKRDRSRRCIGMPVNGDNNLVRRNTEFFSRAVKNTTVGLMGNQPVNFG